MIVDVESKPGVIEFGERIDDRFDFPLQLLVLFLTFPRESRHLSQNQRLLFYLREEVTRGYEIVVGGWAGLYNPF